MLRRGNKQRKDSEPMPITGAAQQQLQQQHQQQQQQQQHGFNAAAGIPSLPTAKAAGLSIQQDELELGLVLVRIF
ncbi:unnamed protein product [Tilletia controversa]|nr:unnamed protein product [Tilletia controversa]